MRDYPALVAYLAARRDMPFIWGSGANDCVSHAAGAVRAQTGEDPLAGLSWSDEKEAYAVLERLGGLVAAISSRLRQIPPALAHRGDIAAVMTGNQLGLFVIEGASLVAPGLVRAVRRSRHDMVLAWSAD